MLSVFHNSERSASVDLVDITCWSDKAHGDTVLITWIMTLDHDQHNYGLPHQSYSSAVLLFHTRTDNIVLNVIIETYLLHANFVSRKMFLK